MNMIYDEWLIAVKKEITFDIEDVAFNYLINAWEDGEDPANVGYTLEQQFGKKGG